MYRTIYYVALGFLGVIAKVDYDGSNKVILATTNIQNPKGLTIDVESKYNTMRFPAPLNLDIKMTSCTCCLLAK